MDIPAVVSLERVKALRHFRGIGWQGNTGRVRHVDIRQDRDGGVRASEAVENEVGTVEVLLARVVDHHDAG